MGGMFSSPQPEASAPPPSEGSSAGQSGKGGKRRSRRGKGKAAARAAAAAAADADDDAPGAGAKASASGGGQLKGAEARLDQVRRLPLALEQAWQEADRLGGLLHGWGCAGGAGVARARAEHSYELAVAFKNIGRLVEAKGKAKRGHAVLLDPPHSDSSVDNGGSEPNDFDRKRTKRLVRKLRDAARKAAPLKLVKVADPWGDEDAAWRARFLEERGTSLMLLLDGLDLRGDPTLKAQRKAVFRCIEAIGAEAKAWAAGDAAEVARAGEAERAAAKAAAEAKQRAMAEQRAKDAAAAAAAAEEAGGGGWKGAGGGKKKKGGAKAAKAAKAAVAAASPGGDGAGADEDGSTEAAETAGEAAGGGGGWQVAGSGKAPKRAAGKKGKGRR